MLYALVVAIVLCKIMYVVYVDDINYLFKMLCFNRGAGGAKYKFSLFSQWRGGHCCVLCRMVEKR
jgi:hypothetical protein